MNKDKQRRAVLKVLYEYSEKSPGSKLGGKVIAKELGFLRWEEIAGAAEYLYGNGYIDMRAIKEIGTVGIIDFYASITSLGIDIVESKTDGYEENNNIEERKVASDVQATNPIVNFYNNAIEKLWKKVPRRYKLSVGLGYLLLVLIVPATIIHYWDKFLVTFDKIATSLRNYKPIDMPAIKGEGLQNGSFEEDLRYWEIMNTITPIIPASSPTVTLNNISPDAVSAYSKSSYSISSIAQSGNKSLQIDNKHSEAPHKYFVFWQRVFGLKPNKKYKVSFYIMGKINSVNSLWCAFGNHQTWLIKGKYFQIDTNKSYEDWTKVSGVVENGDYKEANIYIISSDLCSIKVDNITLQEIE